MESSNTTPSWFVDSEALQVLYFGDLYRGILQKRTSCDRPCRSMTVKCYPLSKVRGGNRECQAATSLERWRGAIPRPRSGVVAKTSYPTSKVRTRQVGRCPKCYWKNNSRKNEKKIKKKKERMKGWCQSKNNTQL